MAHPYGTPRRPEGHPYGTTGPSKRVGIYARVSTEEQARGGVSLDAQLEELSRYAERQGWEIVERYVDAGVSGSTTKRPAFQRMLKDAHDGHLNVILVYKFDRLSRSALDLIMTTNDLAKWKVDFCSITEQVDTTTPIGKLFLRLMGILAEFELDLIRQRTRFGMSKKARDGYPQFRPPFGYDLIGGQLVVDEARATVVRKIYDMRSRGASLSRISRETGVSRSTVSRILRNPIYRGLIAWKGQLVRGIHKPIIRGEI